MPIGTPDGMKLLEFSQCIEDNGRGVAWALVHTLGSVGLPAPDELRLPIVAVMSPATKRNCNMYVCGDGFSPYALPSFLEFTSTLASARALVHPPSWAALVRGIGSAAARPFPNSTIGFRKAAIPSRSAAGYCRIATVQNRHSAKRSRVAASGSRKRAVQSRLTTMQSRQTTADFP